MPKRFSTKISARDFEILSALERTVLSAAQLCRLSLTFAAPFRDEHNLRRRLRRLADSGLISCWPYAIACDGRSPNYFKLTRDGYRLIYGSDAPLPHRRCFEEVSHGHHYHTKALADFIVLLATKGFTHGVTVRNFARENSLKLEANGFTMFPDCAFQLVRSDGRVFHFVVELDNGTERVRTKHDIESIERKLRGYDAHNAQFAAHDKDRYLVLFVTTRSQQRMQNILDAAAAITTKPNRTVFLGANVESLEASDPFEQPVFADHRGLKRMLLPKFQHDLKTKESVQRIQKAVLTCGPVGRPSSDVIVRP